MQTLNQLTQSHLCVLILDEQTHNPIPRMPLYAEVCVVETLPPYELGQADLGHVGSHRIFRHERVGPLLRRAIAERLSLEALRALTDETRQGMLELAARLLDQQEGLPERPEVEIKAAAAEAVRQALAEFGIPPSPPTAQQVRASFPLGYLATDHAGYASFDLTRVPQGMAGGEGTRYYAFLLYPMGQESERVDVLAQGRITREAIFAKVPTALPTITHDLKTLNLPSMQNPSLVDWYFSPGSFATQPEMLVGADGCERLFPAQIALHEFLLRQVIRLVDTPRGIDIPAGYKFGYVDEYKVTWQSLGHSLGEILYSLPLAPGESVKLAVVDWSWESDTSRTEETRLTEELLHRTHRDRTIVETVKAGLREMQTGSSFMGGLAGSAGASGTMGAASGAVGLAGSFGGSTATSSGSRDLAAENVQRLSDNFAQASSAQRELNSTVVIQARQEQKESIQTRTFTNYNHSHTLTILYYEVLRHFKVAVEWIRRRPAILVPSPRYDFDDGRILQHRYILEDALLDPTVEGGFDVLEKLIQLRRHHALHGINPAALPPRPFAEGDIGFSLFEFGIASGSGLRDKSDELITLNMIVMEDGIVTRPRLRVFVKAAQTEDLNANDRFNDDSTMTWFIAEPPGTVSWRNLLGFEFILHDSDEWRMTRLWITGFFTGGLIPLTENVEVNYFFLGDGSSNTVMGIRRPAPDPAPHPRIPTPEQSLSAEEYHLLEKLRAHLAANEGHYRRLIALRRDPNLIALEFEALPWQNGESLSDHADPYPLEIFGSFIAYPFTDAARLADSFISELFNAIHSNNAERHAWVIEKLATLSESDLEYIADRFMQMRAKAEKLLTLPTRGVFAEGKLGHCNISEEIDNTRFWKWEEHPLPVEAPGINPATPITPTPQATTIAPTPFPTNIVTISAPTAAPDPSGMSDALKLLGTPNIFRDMSGLVQTADLLKKLSDNTISIAEAANKARAILGNQGSSGGSSSGGSGGSGGGSGGSSGGGHTGGGSSGGSGGGSGGSGGSGGGSGGGSRPSAAELNERAESLKGMVGYTNPQVIKDGLAEIAKQQSRLADPNLIASNDPTFVPALTPDQVRAYEPVNPNAMIISKNPADREYAMPSALTLLNWKQGNNVYHYTGSPTVPVLRPMGDIYQIVLHESAGTGIPIANDKHPDPHQRASVHFSVNMDGTAHQNNDVREHMDHGEQFNPHSVGIEFANIVWSDTRTPGEPVCLGLDTTTHDPVRVRFTNDHNERIRADTWVGGHPCGGVYYTLPVMSQLESLVILVEQLMIHLNILKEDESWMQLIPHPRNQTPDTGGPARTFFVMSSAPSLFARTTAPGLIAHRCFSRSHGDGTFQALYTWLRLARRFDAPTAYATARMLVEHEQLPSGKWANEFMQNVTIGGVRVTGINVGHLLQ